MRDTKEVKRLLIEALQGEEDGTSIRVPVEDLRALLQELARLERWKEEGAEVIQRWEKVWHIAGRPGVIGSMKSDAVIEEIKRLQKYASRGVQAILDEERGDRIYLRRPDGTRKTNDEILTEATVIQSHYCNFRWITSAMIPGKDQRRQCQLRKGHDDAHRDGQSWVKVGAEDTVRTW